MARRIAVVLGSADCWAEDLERFYRMYNVPVDIFAVNDAGWLYTGPVRHWCSLHPELFPELIKKRSSTGADSVGSLWTGHSCERRVPEGVTCQLEGHWGPGSSALFAVTVALALGYSRIVLCGVPMMSTPHAKGASTWDGKPWPETEVAVHREGWTHHRDRLHGVRAMSGWLTPLLGFPEGAFLHDRTLAHKAMSRNTVLPPIDSDGNVEGAIWYCPSCGDEKIVQHRNGADLRHCRGCGRDFSVDFRHNPWWAWSEMDLITAYPERLLKGATDG